MQQVIRFGLHESEKLMIDNPARRAIQDPIRGIFRWLVIAGLMSCSNLFGDETDAEVQCPIPMGEAVNTQLAVGAKAESPIYRGLDANLYMQISAEYRACCLQAFRWSRKLVHEKIVSRNDLKDGKPLAVVLDLDETVLDNRRFQSRQIREGWTYNQEFWAEWEKQGGDDVMAIPGAVAFIQHIESMGIQPVYITNRNERAHAELLEVLKHLEIGVPATELHCANEETKSNKTSRRDKVREKFDVILWIGDNLRDFDDVFRYDEAKGIEGRKASVDENEARFGDDWVILPNPAYGEWNKALGKGVEDTRLLDPQLPPDPVAIVQP